MSSPRNILIIVNPVAGQGRGPERAVELDRALRRGGWDVTLERTTADRSGADIVLQQQDHRWNAIAAIGGDGTLQEAVAGSLAAGLSVPIVFVATGTANVIALTLGLPRDVDELARLVDDDATNSFDVGWLPDLDRYFLLMATIGFPAEIVRAAPRALKRRFGFLAYLAAAVKSGVRGMRGSQFRLEMDGESVEVRGNTVFLANLGRLADVGVAVHPNTDPRDGRLDVIVVRGRGWMGTLAAAFDVLLRRHRESPHLWARQAAAVTVDSDPHLAVQIDGELLGHTPLRLRVLPRAISLFVPRSSE